MPQIDATECLLLVRLALLLANPVNVGMDNSHVSCQSIVARERLFLRAQVTSDFHLAAVVNRILVAGEVVWP
jgi:hypothetical protein